MKSEVPRESVSESSSLPALEDLERAFDEGDFLTASRGASALLEKTTDENIREKASALLARTRPDPAIKWLLLMTALIIVTVFGYWLRHAPR